MIYFAYQRNHHQLQSHHDQITANVNAHREPVKETEQALIKLVRFMNSIDVVIKSSKNDDIRILIKTLFSNLSLHGRTLRFSWVSDLFLLCNEGINHKWLGFCDDVRTDYHQDLLSISQVLPSKFVCNDQSE